MHFRTRMNFRHIYNTLSLLSLASAQTYTHCDPLKAGCSPDPALGGQVSIMRTDPQIDSRRLALNQIYCTELKEWTL
jgi:hypothetical protein